MQTNRDTQTVGHGRFYHECSPDNASRIIDEGLQATPSSRADTIVREDGKYYCPDDVAPGEATDYAVQLVYELMERKRPSDLPQHNGSVFFFGTRRHSMARRRRVIADIPIDEYEIVAAPWDLANDLFLETMREFEIMNCYPADALDSRVEEYWDGAFRVTEPGDVTEGYEYYVATDVPPEHVVEVEEISHGE